jgi:hypothetical protein
MKIIDAVKTLRRLIDDTLAARLRVMPAVVLTGARQTRKRTLVEKRAQGERRHHTIADFDALDAARRDPEALLVGDDPPHTRGGTAGARPDVGGEAGHRDHHRRAGRFLLAGSANPLSFDPTWPSSSLCRRAHRLSNIARRTAPA